MQGMTGFGSTLVNIEGYIFQISLSSLNHRFIEIHTKLPEGFEIWEPRIRSKIKSRFKRGKFFCAINLTYSADTLIKKSATELKKIIKEIREVIKDEISTGLGDVFLYTKYFLLHTTVLKIENMWAEFENALNRVIDETHKMRIMEGEKTFNEMKRSIEVVKKKAEKIYKIKNKVIMDKLKRLRKEVKNLLPDSNKSNWNTLLTETVTMLEKHDFSEEITRLREHIKFFEDTMKKEEAGKKLNFIVQEMLRETHTLSNKALDTRISKLCVEIKNELEKIKEHSQNVE